MPSTVSCSYAKYQPYPGYVVYNATITFDYVPTLGVEVCRMPPPVASYFVGAVESSKEPMSEGPTNKFTKNFFGLTNEPTKARVYFKEVTATQQLDSTGCPCTNCRTAKNGKKKHKNGAGKGKKKK